jgi:hypothetical protein
MNACLVSRAWRAAVDERVEMAALRLVVWETRRMGLPRWVPTTDMIMVLYESNCLPFCSSYIVGPPISARLELVPMSRLSPTELSLLRLALGHPSSRPFSVQDGEDWYKGALNIPNLWLTPTWCSSLAL